MSQFAEKLSTALAPIQPDGVREMIESKLNEVLALIQKNNANVARVVEAKDTDPNSADYQDATWKRVVNEGTDDALTKKEAQFQKLEAAREKALAELREMSKAHMQPALSEEEVQKTRKLINEGKSVIADAMKVATGYCEMADQMLTLAGKPVENGIAALIPQPDSLMNARGRKSGKSDSAKGPYAARLASVAIDGEEVVKVRNKRDGSTETITPHMNHIAEKLSRKFNEAQFSENQVTAEEVETAYYESYSVDGKPVAFRDHGSMPVEHEFTFTKGVTVQNPNDDSTKVLPHTVKVKVVRNVKDTSAESDTEENKSENTEENKTESK